jgi:hypothetical protein
LIATLVAITALTCGGSAQAQTALAVPGAIQVTARSETSLSLRWKDRSRSEAYYKVRVAGRVRRLAADRQAITVTGLRPGVAYRVAVQACSRAGRCSKAATGTATTAAARPALAPSISQLGPSIATEPDPTPPTSQPEPAPTPPTTTVDVTGVVTVTTGNCMPGRGPRDQVNPCRTSPAAGARVLLYGPVLKHHIDFPVTLYPGPRTPNAEATTNAAGRFHLVVEPGTYSFLVDAGAGPECSWSDMDWSACPHTLLAPSQAVDLNVDHAVW